MNSLENNIYINGYIYRNLFFLSKFTGGFFILKEILMVIFDILHNKFTITLIEYNNTYLYLFLYL